MEHGVREGSIVPKVIEDFTPRRVTLLCFTPQWAVELFLLTYFSMLNTAVLLTPSPTSISHIYHSRMQLSSSKCCSQSSVSMDNREENKRIYLPSILSVLGSPPTSCASCCHPDNSYFTLVEPVHFELKCISEPMLLPLFKLFHLDV